jgi:hypothetical protein
LTQAALLSGIDEDAILCAARPGQFASFCQAINVHERVLRLDSLATASRADASFEENLFDQVAANELVFQPSEAVAGRCQ